MFRTKFVRVRILHTQNISGTSVSKETGGVGRGDPKFRALNTVVVYNPSKIETRVRFPECASYFFQIIPFYETI